MSISLNSLVEEGSETNGLVAKIIIITTADSYREFQKIIQNGSGLYPDLSAEMKAFADKVTVGKVLQPYKD